MFRPVREKVQGRVTASRFELALKRQKVARVQAEPPDRSALPFVVWVKTFFAGGPLTPLKRGSNRVGRQSSDLVSSLVFCRIFMT